MPLRCGRESTLGAGKGRRISEGRRRQRLPGRSVLRGHGGCVHITRDSVQTAPALTTTQSLRPRLPRPGTVQLIRHHRSPRPPPPPSPSSSTTST
ncbi:hypothetical protein CALCODRAFT_274156 [Calocera cornea HHB12733]|uniref:Uncharacterized protein n=1 Tax=Calocera cornea HHB12733 TaxID=1353952 RepID=A0A165G428_9BASI|nr:hypothetical protein CALCODRAFT_274156 [Calocera cornea HHB12733]